MPLPCIPASLQPVSVTRNIGVVDMVIRPIVNPLDFNVKWHPWCERIYLGKCPSAKENDRKHIYKPLVFYTRVCIVLDTSVPSKPKGFFVTA